MASTIKYIPPVGVERFIELKDTPTSYSGEAKKGCLVKTTEDGLEFIKVIREIDVYEGSGAFSVSVAADTAVVFDVTFECSLKKAALSYGSCGYDEVNTWGTYVTFRGWIYDAAGLKSGASFWVVNTTGTTQTVRGHWHVFGIKP